MKQVININFQGRVVPIETTAFEILKNYTDSLNKHFVNEEGKEEIINDIESRIGELFQQRIKNGSTCITDDDVNAVINSIGKPEDFEPLDDEQPNATPKPTTTSNANQQSSNTYSNNLGHKRLFRDENDKVLGGVCAGLANYFNIDIVIVRIIFVILFFSFGFGIIPYLIMWVVVPSTSANQIGGAVKKMFRDNDNKIIAGVCSGIANYFGINVWIPRILFLLPFLSFISHWHRWGIVWGLGDIFRFSFSPTSLIIYIILWIVIPEAITTTDKLAMKGEKVDLDSIKNSVVEEMKTVGKRAEKFSAEASSVISDKAKTVSNDVQNFAKRNRGGLGNAIAMLFKIFAYFIIGTVAISLSIALFALGISAIGIFPLKDFILNGFWQNVFAWGTLLLFIIVPIIGILTWIIRRITKSNNNSKILRLGFISLWIIGWCCFILLIVSVHHDFRRESSFVEQDVNLPKSNIAKLEFIGAEDNVTHSYRHQWLKFEPFDDMDNEDTVFINNVHFRIVKSNSDSFKITISKNANGSNKKNADTLASIINYNLIQNDSIIKMPVGITINKKNKFRNQHVVITVAVPVGKRIKIDQSIWDKQPFNHVNFMVNENWDAVWGNEERGWTTNVEYIMKSDGLYLTDGTKANGDNGNSKIKINKGSIDVLSGKSKTHIGADGITVTDGNNYRYNDYDKKADSIREMQDKIKQYKIDSLEKEKERLDSIKDKIENTSIIQATPGSISAIIVPSIGVN